MTEVASFSNSSGVLSALGRALEHLKPPPDLSPSEWAERNVRIPVGNAIPGMIRFDNAPYQREPLDMTADPGCSRISLMWGAQVGKTMLALCAQAYWIDHDPQSQMMMQPSEKDLQTWLETKFNPMVDANPRLQGRLAKPRGREGVNNQNMKSYPGGFAMFAWSGSPNTQRGRSAPKIVCDETDGYEKTKEGHQVNTLWQRAATFGDQRLLLEISTPTIKGQSWIESAYEAGDGRQFYVPCPHCGFEQVLSWSNVKWHKDEEKGNLPDTAQYCCSGCGVLWSDGERVAAIRGAEAAGAGWKATRPYSGHASFHLNELYSCFRKTSDVVRSFLEKKKSRDLQSFVNISLAETWEEKGDGVDAGSMRRLCEPYGPEDLPEGVLYCTAGVDTQNDRLEVEVVGWGEGEESWGVEYRVIYGDPAQDAVWDELDQVLNTQYRTISNRVLRVQAACVDSGGHFAESVLRFCAERFRRRVYAIKGQGGQGKPIWPVRASKTKTKHSVFMVGVDTAKDAVYSRWAIQETGPGSCHLPADPEYGYDDSWFKQATSEQKMTRYAQGRPYYVWTLPPGKRNEALDCRVYAMAAMKSLAARGGFRPAVPEKPRKPKAQSGDDWVNGGGGWF